jgi:hypothetical protein
MASGEAVGQVSGACPSLLEGGFFEDLEPHREQAHSYRGMQSHVGVNLLAKAAQAALEMSLGIR